jgi:hypothetical protein
VLTATVLVSACANSGARSDYYLAVQQSAQAQAAQSEARYRALATIANSGDAASKAVATMAIAMSKDATIAPQYIEDQALSWAKVLATPVATLGGLWIQSDVAKNSSNNARDIQLASFASNESIQLGQQNMVSSLGESWSQGAAASGQQLANLGIAGFDALNVAGGQTVELGVAGLNTADSIAGAGFDANANIATTGFNATTTVAGLGFATADSIATTGMEGMATLGLAGMTGIENVGIAGMTNLNEVSQYGMTTISAVSLAGMNGMENLGTAGMTNLTTLGTAGIDAVGTVGTTGMNLLDSQGTNYTAIIADMQNTIDLLGQELADPITCSPNSDGLYVCQ